MLCIGQLLKVVEDAAIELQHLQAQAAQPRGGLVAADAAGAIHRHRARGFAPGRRALLDVGDEIAEVAHLGVGRAPEMAEAELEVVAVVQQHHVATQHVVLKEFVPLQRAQVAVVCGVRRRQRLCARQAQRHGLGLHQHLQARVGRRGAGAVLERHAGEGTPQHMGVLQRSLESQHGRRAARQGAVHALGRHGDGAQERGGQFTQRGCCGHGVGQRREAVERGVDQRVL